jgi:hypothetical protein
MVQRGATVADIGTTGLYDRRNDSEAIGEIERWGTDPASNCRYC